MQREEITLFIPHSVLKNQNISSYALATYCYLQMLTTTTGFNIHYVSAFSIASYLVGEVDHQRKFLENIRKSIFELVDNNIISISQEIKTTNGHYAVDCSNLWVNTDKENFTIIYYDEILKIMKINSCHKIVLLKYFIFLMSTIMSKVTVYHPTRAQRNHVVGYYSLETLGRHFGVSEYSIASYNKNLEEYGLIYIYRHKGYIVDENGFHSLPNIYGRNEDKEYIDIYGKQYFETHNERYRPKKSIVESNKKRRLGQMYRQLIKGNGSDYSKNEIIEIYTYIVEENKKYLDLYNKDKKDSFLDKVRSLEVFNQFKYINVDQSIKK